MGLPILCFSLSELWRFQACNSGIVHFAIHDSFPLRRWGHTHILALSTKLFCPHTILTNAVSDRLMHTLWHKEYYFRRKSKITILQKKITSVACNSSQKSFFSIDFEGTICFKFLKNNPQGVIVVRNSCQRVLSLFCKSAIFTNVDLGLPEISSCKTYRHGSSSHHTAVSVKLIVPLPSPTSLYKLAD